MHIELENRGSKFPAVRGQMVVWAQARGGSEHGPRGAGLRLERREQPAQEECSAALSHTRAPRAATSSLGFRTGGKPGREPSGSGGRV